MKRWVSLLLPFLAVLATPDCGKKGPLQLPIVRTPQAAQDFGILQRGDQLVLSWTNPTAYVDGNPLQDISEVEVWMAENDKSGAGPAQHMTAEEFEDKARLLARFNKSQFGSLLGGEAGAHRFSYVYTVETGKTRPGLMTFAVRIRDEKRRPSAFSELLSIEVQAAPAVPQNVRVSLSEKYIEVRWDPAAASAGAPASPGPAGYNIYRSEGEELPLKLNSSPVKEDSYRDQGFSFGRTYRYFVRAVASDKPPFRESESSNKAEILTRDTFPPAPPVGLAVVPGKDFIALSWEPNKESDLAGYRIWRKEAGQPDFVLLQSLPATETAYSDSLVEMNKRYDYAISALDDAGNESGRSETASGFVRESFS
jgi:hypothetical protein